MEFDDSFFLDNLIGINDSFVDFLSHYDFSYVPLENKLTFNDVYLIARDFISFKCPKYLPLYDDYADCDLIEVLEGIGISFDNDFLAVY